MQFAKLSCGLALLAYVKVLQGQTPTLLIAGTRNEILTSTVLKATVAPPELLGSIVQRGKGYVSPAASPSTGVRFFQGGQQNTDTSSYQYTGQRLSEILDISSGSISFTLTSQQSFAQRLARPTQEYVFSAATSPHQYPALFEFIVGTSGGYLVFNFNTGASGDSWYFVTPGTEDKLFGQNVSLRVALQWTGATTVLSLNGVPVLTNTKPQVLPLPVWSDSSQLTIGANAGGYFACTDLLSNFTVSASQPVSANQPESASQPVSANRPYISAPKANSTLTGAVTISIGKTAGIASAQILLDGFPVGPNLFAPIFTAVIETSAFANGNHLLSGRTWSVSGVSTTSDAISVTFMNQIKDISAPSVPQGLRSSAVSSSQIQLLWSSSTDNVGVTGYRLYRDGAQLATVNGTTYSDVGLSPNTSYTYGLSAFDAAGNTSPLSPSLIARTSTLNPTIVPTGNAIIISDTSGLGLTDAPVSISRFFSQGEISSYAQPAVDGAALAVWQCDRKTSWSDGSLSHAIVSFAVTVPPYGKLVVSFKNNAMPSSAGTQAQTYAAALTVAQALTFNDSPTGAANGWNAQMELAKQSTQVINARSALAACGAISTDISTLGCRYWLAGPMVSQIIVEDRSPARSLDSGFATNHPVHPIFVLTFYKNWQGVKVEFIGENAWIGNLAGSGMQAIDDSYSLTLKTGPALSTVYTQPSLIHYGRTRWRLVRWSGNAPGGNWDQNVPQGYGIDYNLPYMIASGVIPNFDLTTSPPPSYYDPNNRTAYDATGGFSEVATYNASDQCDEPNESCTWEKSMGTAGGRPDLGLIPRWFVGYLYSMGSSDPNARAMYKVMYNIASASGSVPIHYRENLTDRSYCSYTQQCRNQGLGTINAYGRPISIDARLDARTYPGFELSGAAVDALPVSGLSTNHGWLPEANHQYDFTYVAYVVTGEWYFLEEAYAWASWDVALFASEKCSYCRGGTFGFLAGSENRGQAWELRDVARAAFLAPDFTPEKAYFTEKLENNFAIREGWYNVTNGFFYDQSTASPWSFGRQVVMRSTSGFNPLNYQPAMGEMPTSACCDRTKEATEQQPWSYHYNIIAIGHIVELGFTKAKAVRDAMGKFVLSELMEPTYNPYLGAQYYMPVTDPTGNHFKTWAAVKSVFLPSVQVTNTWPEPNYEHGYNFIYRAAASFVYAQSAIMSDGSVATGQQAWAWLSTHMDNQNKLGQVPHWGIVPRLVPPH